jgi:hypothetical protein
VAEDIVGTIEGLLQRQAKTSAILNGDPDYRTPGLIAEVQSLHTINQIILIMVSTNMILLIVILGVLWSLRP